MLSNSNFLILDEPTNHLDMVSKEILENALNQYTGTVLYVSHDRYFINETATRILDLQNHTFVNYIGNYDYYLEKNEELTKIYAASKDDEDNKKGITAASSDAQPDTTASSDNGKLSWQQQKELQAKRRKIENEYKKTEERIAQCEDIISGVDEELMKPEVATNSAKCNELSEKRSNAEEELSTLYEKWEQLAEELEEFN